MPTFLTAKWKYLALFNYPVPKSLLERHCPAGTQPDELHGESFVSLVAFHFVDTRVLGIPWPGFRNFTEVNLRFYVRAGRQRGVVFIRELVPQRFVAWMARATYNEPYSAVPMRGTVVKTHDSLQVRHSLKFPAGTQRIELEADPISHTPDESSNEHWFKEHRWGFGRSHLSRTIRYEVRHPKWAVHPVRNWKLDWDWGAVYGAEWKFLQLAEPHSVMLAKGSRVSVGVHGALNRK